MAGALTVLCVGSRVLCGRSRGALPAAPCVWVVRLPRRE